MGKVKRPEEKSDRRSRAAETRRRMLDAAITCFTGSGYVGTTMAAIAEEAGVAVQTLYFTFHTKAELLQETFDRAVLGDGPPVPPSETEWYKAMAAEPSIEGALGHLVSGVTEILERVAPLRPVFEAAAGEEGVAQVWERGEQLRLEGYRSIIGILTNKQSLSDVHDAESATDVLMVLLGPDTFRAFTQERKWSLRGWRSWVAGVLRRELFDRDAQP